MTGKLTRFLENDHRELEALFEESRRGGEVHLVPFEAFRERLLRHIGWEEKILLPAAAKAQGEPVSGAAQLRRDHGRIAGLLTRRPTLDSMDTLERILEAHNDIEEGAGGVYEACDQLLEAEADALIDKMRNAPRVPLAPFYEGPIQLPER